MRADCLTVWWSGISNTALNKTDHQSPSYNYLLNSNASTMESSAQVKLQEMQDIYFEDLQHFLKLDRESMQ